MADDHEWVLVWRTGYDHLVRFEVPPTPDTPRRTLCGLTTRRSRFTVKTPLADHVTCPLCKSKVQAMGGRLK